MSTSIFLPAFALAALTFAVVIRVAAQRIITLQRERIHPQKIATSSQLSTHLPDSRAADNLRNLCELPILFYVALVIAQLTGQTGSAVLILAWAFVLLRAAHSAIHCSYNRVTHRFTAFAASLAALIGLWAVLAVGMAW